MEDPKTLPQLIRKVEELEKLAKQLKQLKQRVTNLETEVEALRARVK